MTEPLDAPPEVQDGVSEIHSAGHLMGQLPRIPGLSRHLLPPGNPAHALLIPALLLCGSALPVPCSSFWHVIGASYFHEGASCPHYSPVSLRDRVLPLSQQSSGLSMLQGGETLSPEPEDAMPEGPWLPD